MIVVSDTSPICYLLLIGQIELLYHLYGKVLIPKIVEQELLNKSSPEIVRDWISKPPEWLVVYDVQVLDDEYLEVLDEGEKAAIILAEQQKADLIIIDEALGRKIAYSRNLRVTGLLGILDEAAQQKLISFTQIVELLKTTTFRISSQLLDSVLKKYQ